MRTRKEGCERQWGTSREIKEMGEEGGEGADVHVCVMCLVLKDVVACVYLYCVSRLQSEGAVLSEDGQRAGEHSTQNPC